MQIPTRSSVRPVRTSRGRSRRRFAVSIALALSWVEGVVAEEFLDGRLRVHGYAELEIRAFSDGFSETPYLSRWQHALGLEFEAEVVQRQWGWLDRLDASLRVEGRYDAIYSDAVDLFGGKRVYGNRSRQLPRRLRDARNADYAGTVAAPNRQGEASIPRHPDARPVRVAPDCRAAPAGPLTQSSCVPGSRQGYPGMDWMFVQRGADGVAGNVETGIVGARLNRVTGNPSEAHLAGVPERSSDDPARLATRGIANASFALQGGSGGFGGTHGTRILGPWRPEEEVRSLALHAQIPNPLRGRVVPTALYDPGPTASSFLAVEVAGIRYYRGDPALGRLPDGFTPARIDPRDPFIAFIQQAGDDIRTDFGQERFRDAVPESFGGDFSGVMPCMAPRGAIAEAVRRGTRQAPRAAHCVPGAHRPGRPAGSYQEPLLVRIGGGQGEAPFRPAPDASNLDAFTGAPQGLYLPSRGLRAELARGALDSLPFDISQRERSFNRGASQRRNKEIAEAFLDAEFLEGSLWLRLGLQNIVWGKTEIFQSLDPWNALDLAISSLPDLEESRIALWAARGVYSFYDVGPFSDVSLELALSLQRFQPADVGACGEPYAADSVCALTHGLLAHAVQGAGVVGIDLPESPWRDARGFEVGGRVQGRWRGLSFAITGFHGYADLPYADPIFYYERAVDLSSGRPLAARGIQEPLGRCRRAGQIAPDQRHGNGPTDSLEPNALRYDSSFASHPLSPTPGGVLVERAREGPAAPVVESTFAAPFRGGVGWDADCLRPGGASGEANAFRFDADFLARTNALYNHHANQQLFAWTCLATLGVAAALDPGACAWTLLGSGAPLGSLPMPLVEALSVTLAGDQSALSSQLFLRYVNLGDLERLDPGEGALPVVPLAALNRLFNDPRPGRSLPIDRDGNGMAGDNSACHLPGGACDLGGFDGFRSLHSAWFLERSSLSLDAALTNEQRALLGCGPFWASRCDTSLRARVGDRRAGTRVGSGGAFPGANENGDAIYGAFGGIDLLNAEASALMESWPGREGTPPGYFVTDRAPAPGTLGGVDLISGVAPGFDGGPVCSRPGGHVLPGCRGLESLRVRRDAAGAPLRIEVAFQAGYRPSVDGCVIGSHLRRASGVRVPVHALGASPSLLAELELCDQARTQRPVFELFADGSANPDCVGEGAVGNGSDRLCDALEVELSAAPLVHPLAGCIDSPIHAPSLRGRDTTCEGWMRRDPVEELLAGTAQIFRSEMAALSWNLLLYLAVSSCALDGVDLEGLDRSGRGANPSRAEDPECFAPSRAWERGRCSFTTPHFCGNVKHFFGVTGTPSRTLRAAGNGRFGRRTFIWHSGGESVLRYAKRNVLGFSLDFAEDWTRSSWGVEFSWVSAVPYADSLSPTGLSWSDELSLAISVDRPTFVSLLNPSRTLYLNTQWFFRYLVDYEQGFHANGPVDVFFTVQLATSYFQDRLQPALTSLYDFRSRSGGIAPSLQVRLAESLSLTVGMLHFFGRTQFRDLPVRDIRPASNQVGRHAYRVAVENGLSELRGRDEFFLRLRWAF